MSTPLAQRKYRFAMQLSSEVGMTFGLWILMSLAVVHAVTAAARALTPFEGDFSHYLFPVLPLILAAVGWVHLYRSFPLAVTAGMTRKEFLTAYAVFGAIVVAGGFAFMQLFVILQDLLVPAGAGIDAYGADPLESLTRSAVYFAAGAAAGALMARFGGRGLSGLLAGLVFGAVLLRQVPLELARSEYFGGSAVLELPSEEALLAPLDAVLAALLALVVWAALAKAPIPNSRR
ncbi:hypothetical protein LO763_24165 [Glycomyces sp. A-F 0318]|uniref:hypothetical protein n=1 Tax=Glycomyces amatae TaxID=2881355 RepID=UPI001E2D15C2|nr:hypothetical protein [Glycomyces amatae]MCD0446718.1 hypothetical protein [Glycomyces amatae]